MKKTIAKGLITLMIAGGLVATSGIAAQAHTPNHSVDCSALSVDLKNYKPIVPAVDPIEGQDYVAPSYESQPNPDYIAGWTETINHDAVTHVEYKFVHKFYPWVNQVRWSENPNWNAENNENSHGFLATGETRVVVDTEAWVENIDHPAIGEPTIEVEVDPGQPAIEAVPGVDAKVNTLVVTVDGVEVENTTFGGDFAKTYPFANSYTAHDWSIVVVAWDNSQHNYNASGTTTPCIPELPEQPLPGEWVDSEYACGATEVEQTRQVETATYELVEGVWIQTASTIDVETQTRELTDEEKAANVCPEVVVPEKPITPVSQVESLAFTGDEPNGGGLIGALAGILLGMSLMFTRKFLIN